MSYIIRVKHEEEIKYYGGMQTHVSEICGMERWCEDFPVLTDRSLAKEYDVPEQAQREIENLRAYYQDSKLTIEDERKESTTDKSE